MENNRTQKLTVLIAITAILCAIEILFFYSNTFKFLKSISILIGGITIIYYLYVIGKVFTED